MSRYHRKDYYTDQYDSDANVYGYVRKNYKDDDVKSGRHHRNSYPNGNRRRKSNRRYNSRDRRREGGYGHGSYDSNSYYRPGVHRYECDNRYRDSRDFVDNDNYSRYDSYDRNGRYDRNDRNDRYDNYDRHDRSDRYNDNRHSNYRTPRFPDSNGQTTPAFERDFHNDGFDRPHPNFMRQSDSPKFTYIIDGVAKTFDVPHATPDYDKAVANSKPAPPGSQVDPLQDVIEEYGINPFGDIQDIINDAKKCFPNTSSAEFAKYFYEIHGGEIVEEDNDKDNDNEKDVKNLENCEVY